MNRKLRLVFLVGLYLSTGLLLAQQNPTDGLLRQLKSPMPDTSRVLLLDQVGRTLMYSKPLVAMQYAKEGLALSIKLKYPKGRARLLNRMGSILRITGNYPKALEMHLNSLKVAEEHDDLEGMAKTLNNLGILYSEQNDSKKAIEYYQKTKAIAEQIKDESLVRVSLSNIGADYAILNQLDSARFYTQSAYEMSLKQKGSSADVLLMNLGNIHYRMNNLPIALEYLRLSLPYAKSSEDDRILSQTYFEMAKVFRKLNQRDSCLYYAEQSLKIGQGLSTPKSIYDASMMLSELYDATNDVQSFRYFKMAVAAKDSIFNQEKVKQIQNLSFNEQLRQQEIVEEKNIAEKDRKHNLQIMAIAVFIVTFFLVVVLLSKRKISSRIVESLGLVALLLFFEFINLLMHPFIEHITHHTPVLMLLLLVLMASILAPMHHYLTDWVKEKLAHRIVPRKRRQSGHSLPKH